MKSRDKIVKKMEEYERCDSCCKLLVITNNEDYFEESENGTFVYCEKCWWNMRNR